MNEGHLLFADCLLLSALRFLLTADRLLHSGFGIQEVKDQIPGDRRQVGKSTGDRARLFDSERFKRKFVTTLAGLPGELGFRIVGYVLIPQSGTVAYCSGMKC